MVGKIACFFSCGYTEASGSMQFFLQKINDRYCYEQCIPNSTRKRKGDEKRLDSEINGLSGEKLLEEVYDRLGKPYLKARFDSGEFCAVLIEDDLDGRFDKMSTEESERERDEIRKKIGEILEREIPVYFIYASPEIESWFIADWNNGFGKLYQDSPYFTSNPNRKTFAVRLRKRIVDNLLEGKTEEIEKYAYRIGKYRKLSADLAEVIADESMKLAHDIPYEDITENYSYSKRVHGGFLLRHIDPDTVRRYCGYYFEKCFLMLKNA